MHHSLLETVTVGEMQLGDVVFCHGLICLIDRAPELSKAHAGDRTFWADALVLNREDVTGDAVPYSFTSTSDRPARGLPAEPEHQHRWTVQGNDLACYSIYRPSLHS